MVRRLLTQHSVSECSKRKLSCKYCSKEFLYDTIQVRGGKFIHLLQYGEC